MKTSRTINAVGHIDDDLISCAVESKKRKNTTRVKWGSLAACFVLIVVAAVIAIPMIQDDNPGFEVGDHVRPYKDVTIIAGEVGYYVWPWEYKTVDEKYTVVDISGKEFSGRQKEIGTALIGQIIGNYQATGYDDYSENAFHKNFDVYEIAGISPNELVAVNMDGKYYVFISEDWNPPATFGEVLDLYKLPNTMVLKHFSVDEQGKEKQYFNLSNDDKIWELLSSCRSAEFIDPKDWAAHDRDYISFTITSEALGVYKNAMYVTEDGYLWTNVFNGAFLYHIGADTAEKIIDHALESAVPSEFLPYMYSLAGTITEIGDEYILLDDSAMCIDPRNGIVYKIILTNPKLSRIIETECLKLGDTVQVQYTDYINLEPNAVINSAATISKAQIVDGNALIPE